MARVDWKSFPFSAVAVNTVAGRIVELAVVRACKDKMVDGWHVVVCPDLNWNSKDVTSGLNRLGLRFDRDIKGREDFTDLFPKLMEQLDTKVWVCHGTQAFPNIRAERLRITRYDTERLIPKNVVVCDMVNLDRLLCPDDTGRTLADLAKRWAVIQAEGSALADAMAAALVFRRMFRELPDQLEQLARMQERAKKVDKREARGR